MITAFTTWLGIGIDYLIAAALIAAGVYLVFFVGGLFAKPLRFVGALLIGTGLIIASYSYGKSVGAQKCEAEWKQKNYEAQIAELKREAAIKELAANLAKRQADQLASQNDDANSKINDYQSDVERLSSALASCRRATADDDRRMRDITGTKAGSDKNPK